jgi:hypothetical protein
MNENLVSAKAVGTKTVGEIDDLFRSSIESKEVAEAAGLSPTKIYMDLRFEGCRVATLRFVVDADGKPLKQITDAEIEACGKLTLSKKKK